MTIGVRDRLASAGRWMAGARLSSLRFIQRRHRTLLLHSVVALGGFLLAYAIVAVAVFPDEGVAVPDVKVPGVVGLAFADAQRRLVGLGLKVVLGESRFSADAPKSTVLSQNPASGAKVTRGTQVALDVSDGQQRTTMPALAGLTRDDGERALKELGLEVGQVTEETSDEVRGQILSSRPDSGQIVPVGTRVDLVVSAGPAELTMPDVTGRDLSAARALLEQLGLTLAPVRYDSTSSVASGTVISQTPASGTPIATGTPVTLRVAGRP